MTRVNKKPELFYSEKNQKKIGIKQTQSTTLKAKKKKSKIQEFSKLLKYEIMENFKRSRVNFSYL
jgi:hypothetical protein